MTDRHTAEQRARLIERAEYVVTTAESTRNAGSGYTYDESHVSFSEALARDVLALVAEVERVTRENEAAHRALDDFDVPRDEPHFRSPYMLSGRIRWLRSHLVVDANQRAGRLIDEAQAAEAERASLREQNQQLRDALGRAVKTLEHAEKWAPVHPSYLGEAANAARAALGDGEQQ